MIILKRASLPPSIGENYIRLAYICQRMKSELRHSVLSMAGNRSVRTILTGVCRCNPQIVGELDTKSEQLRGCVSFLFAHELG